MTGRAGLPVTLRHARRTRQKILDLVLQPSVSSIERMATVTSRAVVPCFDAALEMPRPAGRQIELRTHLRPPAGDRLALLLLNQHAPRLLVAIDELRRIELALLLIDDLLGDFQHGRIGQRQVGMADLLGLAPFLVCATSSAGSYRRAPR
jgi:hypothetical protein